MVNPYEPPQAANAAPRETGLEMEAGWVGPLLGGGVICWLVALLASVASATITSAWERSLLASTIGTMAAAGTFCVIASFRRYRANTRHSRKG